MRLRPLSARMDRARPDRARNAPARQRHRRPGHEPARADRVDRPPRPGRHRPLLAADDRPGLRSGPLVLRQGARAWLAARDPRGRARADRRRRRTRRAVSQPIWLRDWPLWLLRIWAGGLAFMALTFLIGRVAEGLVAGTGAVTAVTFGVGTMAGSLGPTVFGHLPDALALFAAFVLGTRARRPRDWLWVGLLAGIGVLFEYPAASRRSILVVYAALRAGRPGRARDGRRRHPGRARARRLRPARLRRAVAALVPLHVERLHAAAAAGPVRRRRARPRTASGRC